MDIKKLNPWNWFRREEEQRPMPVTWSSRQPDYRPLMQVQQEIDRLFDDVFRSFGLSSSRLATELGRLEQELPLRPTIDIQATDASYILKVELPGVAEEDVKLEVSDTSLILRGEKKREHETDKGQYHHRERVYGSFQRVVDLPEDADPAQIEARFKQGVLTITVGRRPVEKPSTRPIPIQAA